MENLLRMRQKTSSEAVGVLSCTALVWDTQSLAMCAQGTFFDSGNRRTGVMRLSRHQSSRYWTFYASSSIATCRLSLGVIKRFMRDGTTLYVQPFCVYATLLVRAPSDILGQILRRGIAMIVCYRLIS